MKKKRYNQYLEEGYSIKEIDIIIKLENCADNINDMFDMKVDFNYDEFFEFVVNFLYILSASSSNLNLNHNIVEYAEYIKDSVDFNEILFKIPFKEIEKFIRRKKLENIKIIEKEK